MRILVFFDLPTTTVKDRREYRKFRKYLISHGYIMMQESVYVKLALNSSIVTSEKKKLAQNKPPAGLVEILVITEKQFSRIEYLVGKKQNITEDSEKRLIVI